MLEQLLTVAEQAFAWRFHVLVVDDRSPDGTGERVVAFGDERVELLTGLKRGLGDAYLRGFEYALDVVEADFIVQMDADFSHDPDDVCRLLEGLDEDTDVVIGSRYVPGGRVDEGWSKWRRLLSWGGNLFARYVAGLYHVRDCTAGFKVLRASVVRAALPFRFRVQGYVFQVALLHYLIVAGARVKELPITFADRLRGETKLGMRDVGEFFLHVWSLRLLSHKTFVKFALTGLSGVFVNLGCFHALFTTGVHRFLASAVAIEVSILSNFLINNYWTFRRRDVAGPIGVRGLKFNLVSLLTLGISFSTFVALDTLFPDNPPVWHQAAGIVPGAVVNYFANSYWTFRPR
ncbi:MAG: glycosyltransferase family 2 protein [Pseudomonadales bacterium]|nr:glycosyltransferase family 2 protein [Pseudomonadales bacterium]MDP6471873.1 glycosyltransferase family 2 protein [Pseudomonadales bacterium]MDP6826857.1 glycosyltransferase family 2 protein [Pseudomonadales bacterium]MDP6970865.1 glycosyltransferase family 2 protein [Pseudomonadales bacterium]